MPVVSALGQLEVLADVFDADWFYIKTQAVASLVRDGFGQGCVDVSNTAMPPFTKRSKNQEHFCNWLHVQFHSGVQGCE